HGGTGDTGAKNARYTLVVVDVFGEQTLYRNVRAHHDILPSQSFLFEEFLVDGNEVRNAGQRHRRRGNDNVFGVKRTSGEQPEGKTEPKIILGRNNRALRRVISLF